MQETHLKKIEKTSILDTLRSFGVGESEFISTSESGVAVDVWRARYSKLRGQGIINSRIMFIEIKEDGKDGTLIIRKS